MAVAAIALGIAVLLRPEPATQIGRGELVVSFLDVGQGDATLLQRGSASVLVDTGPPGGPIIGRLRTAGVRRLDLLVITHAEANRAAAAADVLKLVAFWASVLRQ